MQPKPYGTIGLGAASAVKASAATIYNDNHIITNSFAFPLSYGVSEQCRIPGMLWQSVTMDKLDQSALSRYSWKEEYIKTYNQIDTACYPGISVWESAVVSCKGYVVKPFKESYITNTERVDNE